MSSLNGLAFPGTMFLFAPLWTICDKCCWGIDFVLSPLFHFLFLHKTSHAQGYLPIPNIPQHRSRTSSHVFSAWPTHSSKALIFHQGC